MPSVSEFQAHYRNRSDDELEWIAIHQSKDLLPEALQALRDETERRGLGRSIAIETQARARQWSKEEIFALVEQYRRVACPECGRQGERLNAVNAAVTHSFILISNFQWKLVVGCPNCICNQVDKLTKQSLVAGWWSIPWGPIYTIRALIANSKAKTRGSSEEATPELYNLVVSNIGEFAAGLHQK